MSSFLVKRASWHCTVQLTPVGVTATSTRVQAYNPAWGQLFHAVTVTFVYLVKCIVFIMVVYLFSECVVEYGNSHKNATFQRCTNIASFHHVLSDSGNKSGPDKRMRGKSM